MSETNGGDFNNLDNETQSVPPVQKVVKTTELKCPRCRKTGSIFAVIFLIFFLASLTVAGWFYVENTKGITENGKLKVAVSQLEGGIRTISLEKETLQSALNESNTQLADLESQVVQNSAIEGEINVPYFEYAPGTQVLIDRAVELQGTSLSLVYKISPNPIHVCGECDGNSAPIMINIYDKTKLNIPEGSSFAEGRLKLYAEREGELIVNSSDTFNEENGSLTNIFAKYTDFTGNMMPNIEFEELVFEGDNWVIVATFNDFMEGEKDNDIWKLFKDSSDFSSIE